MNLKIEDLEKEMSMKKAGDTLGNESASSRFSITSTSFVHASMKEALANSLQHGTNIDMSKGNLLKENNSRKSSEPPKEYEKLLQKLEADIRGHIRVKTYNINPNRTYSSNMK